MRDVKLFLILSVNGFSDPTFFASGDSLPHME